MGALPECDEGHREGAEKCVASNAIWKACIEKEEAGCPQGLTGLSLSAAPEVLQPVGVDFAVYVLDGVVNYLMLECPKAFVRLQRISVKRGARFDMIADFSL